MVSQNLESVTLSRMNRRSLLKRAGVLGLSIPVVGALSACGTNDEPFVSSGANAASGASGEVTEVTITAKDVKFEPKDVSVPANQPVRLSFINKGAIEHDWEIHDIEASDLKLVSKPSGFNQRMQGLMDEAKRQGRPYAGAGAGESMVIEFTPTKAGVYDMGCMVPGHKSAGMVGTFTVVGANGEAPSANQSHGHDDPHVVTTTLGSGTPYVADRLPNPAVAAPVGQREPRLITQEIEIKELVGYLDDGVAYEFWTFGGTIPGPMLRVRVGDTVELTLKNPADSKMAHNIDLHAVTGPGGGGHDTLVAPGQSATIRFKALNPGVYVYHCATAPIPHHISAGMYGLIVVEPEEGLPPVDREFYVMQGDFYLEGKRGEQGLRTFSMDKLLDERPDYVVFNGAVGALTDERSFKATTGEKIRIFFGVGGPNVVSSFHVIGEIFDRVYPEGASEVQTNVQTTLVPSGGATIVEFTADVPGTLLMVDHSLGRLAKGAVGMIQVEGEENPEVFEVVAKAG